MKHILYAILLIAITAYAGEITGKVTDIETSEPLAGANVYPLNVKGLGASTNIDGEYWIDGLQAGTYEMIASHIAYASKVIKVEVIEGEETTLNFQLEPSSNDLDAVIVTATKEPRVLKDVPFRTEVISRQKLEKAGATDLYGVIDDVPGVRVESQCSNCNFTQVRMGGLDGGYAEMLIDGQPIFSGLAGVYGLQQIQSANVEQIEIVKGAGSALYGGNALGGVINVRMKEPGYTPGTRVGFETSEHGDMSLFFSGSMRREKFASSWSFQHDYEADLDHTGNNEDFLETGHYEDIGSDGYTDKVLSRNTGGGLKLWLTDPIGEGSRINLFGRAMTEFRKGGYIPTYDDPFDPDAEHISTDRYELGGNIDKSFGLYRNLSLGYTMTMHYRDATNGAAWDKAIDAGMVDDELQLTGDGQAYIDENGFDSFRSHYYPKPFISDETMNLIDLSYSNPFPFGGEIMVGGQYRLSHLEQDINGDPITDIKKARDIGLYTQIDFFPLGYDFEVVLGGRLDIHSSSDDLAKRTALEFGESYEDYEETAFNPRIALRYSISDALIARASFGRGFRVPYLFAEDLHLCASSPKIFKGSDLQSEKSQSYSLDLDYQKPMFQTGVNIFLTQIEGKIEFIDPDGGEVPEGYDFRWTNAGNATSTGVEVFLSGKATEWMEYQGDIGYTMARYDEKRYGAGVPGHENSDLIPRTPAISAGLSLDFEPVDMLDITFSGQFTGPMYIDHVPEEDEANLRFEKTDPFLTLNARLGYRLRNNIELYIIGDNITDYTQPTRDITDAAYMYAPLYGRTVRAGVSIEL